MQSKISSAKSLLVLDQPFFASILLGMPMIEDKNLPKFGGKHGTMATNGSEIRFDPDFVKSLSKPELIFVLAHETLHCVFQHMHRRGEKNPAKWNIAADYVINDMLQKEFSASGIGVMPKGCLYNPALTANGENTEQVYAALPDSPPNGPGQPGDGANGGSFDICEDASSDPAENAAKEQEMKVRIIQAANVARMAGKLSAGMAKLVGDATRSKVDWKAVLRNFLTSKAKTEWSYAKPKRRFLADDIALPGLNGHAMESIVVAIDCSGSIYSDKELLDSFAAEIKGIVADVSPNVCHVLYFDSSVLKVDSYDKGTEIDVKPIGGGGTDFIPIFEDIDNRELNPAATVVLTDMYGSFPKHAPSYPVLWASYGAETAPFGELVSLKA